MQGNQMSIRLIGVLAKIERANKHIMDLEREVSAFIEDNPGRELLACDTDPETGDIIYRVKYNRPIPIAIQLIAGDIAHNLRSALDHLVWQLVEAGGGRPNGFTALPVCKDTEHFQSRKTTKKVAGIAPEAKRLVELMQPYNALDNMLLAITEVNNFDKHRLLFVVAKKITATRVGIGERTAASLPPGAGTVLDLTFDWITDGDTPRLLKEGDVFVRFVDCRSHPDCNLDFAYDIVFSEPEIVRNSPICKFFREVSDWVLGVVDQFRPHL